MRGFGGIVSFQIKSDLEGAKRVTNSLRIPIKAVSLGGVESLVVHPASTTHAVVPREEREKTSLFDNLIRLSVGIEDADDLIKDLQQALDKIPSKE